MRRAADGYQVEDDVRAIEAMIEQMNLATESASKAVDNAILFVAESNKRIKKMGAKVKRVA